MTHLKNRRGTVVGVVEAISTNTDTMEEVGEAVNPSKQAKQEIARDVRELREELKAGAVANPPIPSKSDCKICIET